MKKSCLIITIIVIIVVGLICFMAGRKSMESEVAKYKKLIDYYFPVSEEIFSISGEITEIQDNVLSVESIVQGPYVLPEEWKTEIFKIIVTDETKITKFDMETDETSEANLSDFKVGNQINAITEENIKDKTEFTATSIELFIIPETE